VSPPELPAFGPALTRARAAAGYPTQAEAAAAAGVPRSQVSRLERGVTAPYWTTAARLIGRLGLGLEYFVPEEWILSAARRLLRARRRVSGPENNPEKIAATHLQRDDHLV
jgi:transcriptional regulator with XRE-family HTH domain